MSESNIPDFRNREEEAEFFDTHDFTEFWHEGIPIKPHRTYSESMQVRLDPETDHALQSIADRKGLKKSTLLVSGYKSVFSRNSIVRHPKAY